MSELLTKYAKKVGNLQESGEVLDVEDVLELADGTCAVVLENEGDFLKIVDNSNNIMRVSKENMKKVLK